MEVDHLTPADRIYVRGVAVHPLVVGGLPAVKVYAQEASHDLHDGTDADEARLHQVHRLHLHAQPEPMLGDILQANQASFRNLLLVKGRTTWGIGHFQGYE